VRFSFYLESEALPKEQVLRNTSIITLRISSLIIDKKDYMIGTYIIIVVLMIIFGLNEINISNLFFLDFLPKYFKYIFCCS